MLSAPTPIFLLLSGGPRSLGGPRDQSQAVYCGFRSPAVLGRGRGSLQGDPPVTLASRTCPPGQAGGLLPPHAPVTGTLCPGAPGPFPASQGVAAPPTAQDAGELGSAPDRPPLPMFCPAGAPHGGPRARQPLHPRAGLSSFRLGLGPAQKCSWGLLAPHVLSSLWPPAASTDPGCSPLESPGPGGAVRL